MDYNCAYVVLANMLAISSLLFDFGGFQNMFTINGENTLRTGKRAIFSFNSPKFKHRFTFRACELCVSDHNVDPLIAPPFSLIRALPLSGAPSTLHCSTNFCDHRSPLAQTLHPLPHVPCSRVLNVFYTVKAKLQMLIWPNTERSRGPRPIVAYWIQWILMHV